MMKDKRVEHLVSRWLAGAAFGCMAAWAQPVLAQSAPVVARPVVQSLPGAESKRLASALATLGRNPRDVAALIEAGDAARALQDFDAAIGFYRRADEAAPGDARVKAGLGSAYALSGDPVSAIPLFEAAEKAGATVALISNDRGLAYDLVGDNASAQRYYAMALATASGAQADELRTRLAVSQAIAGQADVAYTTLLPLLNRQDKPGWRTRAFTLAISGDTNEAVDVAQKILPAPLAQNIAPYLRYMPRLTKAQQAAAANLGRFPRASEVGRDDARIAAYAPPRREAAGSGLIPKGQPLGGAKVARANTAKASRAAKANARRSGSPADPAGSAKARAVILAAADPDRVAPPDVKPTIERDAGELPPVGQRIELPSVAPASRATSLAAAPATAPASLPVRVATPTPAPTPTPASTPRPAPTPTPSLTLPTAAAVPGSVPRSSGTGFDLARVSQGSAVAATGQATASSSPASPASTVAAAAQPPASTPAAPPEPGPNQRSLSDIFADLGKPALEAVPVSGAVDIRMITPSPPARPTKVELAKAADAAPAADARETRLKAGEAKPLDPKAKASEGKVVESKVKAPEAKAVDPKAKDAKTKAAEAKAAEAKAAADAKAKAKKPAPPAHPSRIWVQIGVGRDKDAIAFDWRRYNREAPALFKGRQPSISDMGRTNRILVGPFATQKAATAFLADAKKQGFAGALPWTSPAGQVVDVLPAK